MKRFQRQLVRNGRGKLLKTKKAITRAASDVKDRITGVQGNVVTYAKKHPVKTLGLSLLAGALLTRIFHSTRR